jgi:phosphatidylserine decarboxylase
VFAQTSPVDARITQFGTVQSDGTLEQIKGSSFALPAFLGSTPAAQPKQRFYYCVLYLAPGDYHRVHSCADWSITERLHVPGHLLSVSPKFLRTVPNVLSSNERVVLSGAWQHGFFSLTSVGATNVGSIKLVHEPVRFDSYALCFSGVVSHALYVQELHTNVQSTAETRVAVGPLHVQPGDELAHFELGSTVVLVFEAPADFGFALAPGARIKVGQALGGRNRGWTADADVARQRAREAHEAIVKSSL